MPQEHTVRTPSTSVVTCSPTAGRSIDSNADTQSAFTADITESSSNCSGGEDAQRRARMQLKGSQSADGGLSGPTVVLPAANEHANDIGNDENTAGSSAVVSAQRSPAAAGSFVACGISREAATACTLVPAVLGRQQQAPMVSVQQQQSAANTHAATASSNEPKAQQPVQQHTQAGPAGSVQQQQLSNTTATTTQQQAAMLQLQQCSHAGTAQTAVTVSVAQEPAGPAPTAGSTKPAAAIINTAASTSSPLSINDTSTLPQQRLQHQVTSATVPAASSAAAKAPGCPAGLRSPGIGISAAGGGISAAGGGISAAGGSSSTRLGSLGRPGRLGGLASPGSSSGGAFGTIGSSKGLGGYGSSGGPMGSSSSSGTKRLGGLAPSPGWGAAAAGPTLSRVGSRGIPQQPVQGLSMLDKLLPATANGGAAGMQHVQMQQLQQQQQQGQIGLPAAPAVGMSAGSAFGPFSRQQQQQQQPTLAELRQLTAQARTASPGVPQQQQQQQQLPGSLGRISRSPSPQLPPLPSAAGAETPIASGPAAVSNRSPSPVAAAAAAAVNAAFSTIRCWSPALRPAHNSLRSRSSSPAVAEPVAPEDSSSQLTAGSRKRSASPLTAGAVVGQKRVQFSEHLQVFYLPPPAPKVSKRSSKAAAKHGGCGDQRHDAEAAAGDADRSAAAVDHEQQLLPAGSGTLDSRSDPSSLQQQKQGHLVAAGYAPELSWRKARKYKRMAQEAAATGGELHDDYVAAAATAIAMTAAGRDIIRQQQGTAATLNPLAQQAAAAAGAAAPQVQSADVDSNAKQEAVAKQSKKKRKGRLPRRVNPMVAAAAAAVGEADSEALIDIYKDSGVWSPWHQHVQPPTPLEKGSSQAAAIEAMLLEEGLDEQTAAAVMTWLFKEKKAPEVDIVRARLQRFKAVITPYRRPSMLLWLRKCPRLLNNAEATLSAAVAQLLALFSPGLMLPAQAAELLDRCPQLAARTAAVTKTKVDLFCELLGGIHVAPLLLRFPVMLTMSRDRILEVINLSHQLLTDDNDLSRTLVAKVWESMDAAAAAATGAPEAAAREAAAAVQADSMPRTAGAETGAASVGEQQQRHQAQHQRHQQQLQQADAHAAVLESRQEQEQQAAGSLPLQLLQIEGQQQQQPPGQQQLSAQQQQAATSTLDQAQQQQQQPGHQQPPGQQQVPDQRQQVATNTLNQPQQQQQPRQAPLDLVRHLLMTYPAFFIHKPDRVLAHYKRYQALAAAWQNVSSVTGLLGPMMLTDWQFDLFEARFQYLEEKGLLACVRDPKSKSPQVSLTHLSSHQFEEKFPGFAAWRQQYKGVPISHTLTELASNKSKKRVRNSSGLDGSKKQKAGSAESEQGTLGGTKKKSAGGRKRRAAQDEDDCLSDMDEWQSGDSSSDGRCGESDAADCDWGEQLTHDIDLADGLTSERQLSGVLVEGVQEITQHRQGLGSIAADRVVEVVGSTAGVAAAVGSQAVDSSCTVEQLRAGYVAQQHQQQQGSVGQAAGHQQPGLGQQQVAGRKRRQPPRGKSRQREQLELEQEQELLLQQLELEDQLLYGQLEEQVGQQDALAADVAPAHEQQQQQQQQRAEGKYTAPATEQQQQDASAADVTPADKQRQQQQQVGSPADDVAAEAETLSSTACEVDQHQQWLSSLQAEMAAAKDLLQHTAADATV